MLTLEPVAWPVSRLGELLGLLARRTGLSPDAVPTPAPVDALVGGDDETLGRWVETAVRHLDLEAEPVDVPFIDLDHFLRHASPAILRLPGHDEVKLLALAGTTRRAVLVLGPDLSLHRLPLAALSDALRQRVAAPTAAAIDELLEDRGVPRQRRNAVRAAMVREWLGTSRDSRGWALQVRAGAPFARHLRRARLGRHLGVLATAYVAADLLWVLSWWVIGRGALDGRLDPGWLVAWALLLLTIIPCRLLATWSEGVLAIGVGGLLKQRLIEGALRTEPDEIRHEGVGHLLGCVLESENVESLALSSGFLGVFAMVDLALAATVLAVGAGGPTHVLLLVAWVGFTAAIGWRYYRKRRAWSTARVDMTHALVERMVGHRTRLVQEVRSDWHESEDQALERYLKTSWRMDQAAAILDGLIPRGWLLLGLGSLGYTVVSAQASPAALAISVGGILLAYGGLEKLATGLLHVTGAAIAWEQIGPLFHAAARPETLGSPLLALAPPADRASNGDGRPLLEAQELVFRYADRSEPVLRGCSLRIDAGDRFLLLGASGAGKSTLVSLLTGLRRPQSGLLLLGGLDWQTLGADGWRRRVAAAPQFHENHVLAETLAFNLLMGRRWPPYREDLEEAETLCRELGLSELLERMPAGLFQIVGETGWQLSHGERSRLFIARALLQGADVVILDEGFAEIDPETLRQCLWCVRGHARSLLVIAHP
jgi:ATP-binding cassette subfamily B protein